MGLDVTFHPISRDQLRYYFFDVLADAKLAKERSAELAKDSKREAVITRLYRSFPKFTALGLPVGSSFAFAAAVIAGFLHPYWYARGQALSLLPLSSVPERAGLFIPLGKLELSKLSNIPDPSQGYLSGNESASGFMPADKIVVAESIVETFQERQNSDCGPSFDADGVASILAALRYCRTHSLGLIEASDVVVPFTDACFTEIENLRAPFLNRMEA